ncbi:TAT-variant-translocated molybdopterin oxidoreductase [Chitinophaga oryzae]|uniref:TAT-variant-translocated molybdopterin oxidoreductase n=1 Tax=Chitinophaga oryzae TaxID=2725414 RepID=A0AAE6ZKZ9_9BACT|nr:TAT-variant-translocated molybdopterin oxidoreductase [Chitinophaga oryzae]QJB34657.1 TAT-variant-translocated molybdopterin oxidoreductase [Chitinophaga oryzae]QJB41175.1 TAT-variant-translocated molybdopterin oxidoreductase [Chitinophaga oryzae]
MEQKKYWKGLEELHNTEAHQEIVKNEFSEELPFESEGLLNATTPRRDFLKYLGFTTAAATIAASCETPVHKAIPYVNKPEEITPGVANYYASSYTIDGEYVPVVVKTREGRPIKIEGNTLSSITGGSTSAKVQGTVLSLYDVARLRFPTIGGTETTWAELDKQVGAALAGLGGAPVVLLSSSILSPTTKKVIDAFLAKYPNSRHVVHDPVSYSGMLLANEASYGKRSIPSYHFENAKAIVSLGADFIGTWLNPVEYARQFAQTRKVSAKKPEMSKLFQFESHMSLTGANADERYTHKPSEAGAVALALLAAVGGSVSAPKLDAKVEAGIKKAAAELKANTGKALVVSGSNDVNVQLIVNAINNIVGANGTTIDWANPSDYRQGIDADMAKLVSDMNAGSIGAVLVYGANPAYDYFDAAKFSEGLKKVKLSLSFNDRLDETTELCKYAAPDHHFLENWNDAQGKPGYYSFAQPTISPLFKTRAAQDSLLAWTGNTTTWAEYLKAEWISKLGSQEAWDKALQDGVVEPATAPAPGGASFSGDIAGAAAKISSAKKGGKYELVLYEKVAIGNGRQSNNPWLQEMPDPITRATWDNYACISNTLAKTFSAELGDDYEINVEKKELKIKANGKEVVLPMLIIPGMHPEVIAIAVGYGRGKNVGRAAAGIGQNVYPMVNFNGQTFDYFAVDATVEATGKKYPVALTQTHNSYEGRPIVKETTLAEFKHNPKEVNEDREELKKFGKNFRDDATLYSSHPYPGIKWGMSIDLNTCFGCGACTIACQAENNVSVVGKDEVAKAHEMHWIRIDRYFSGDENNPEVVFQPMLCQHCDNAPCENVCPVGATNHSSEGINQMAYNRCIGTRYCANNCPYKVRRLNWRDWNGADSFENNLYDVADMNDNLTRMVLNPDVVVRSRGVMEKCSFCVQRLQEAKLEAKKAGHPLKDGAAKTACQQACGADAIVFGNVNDKNSEIYKIRNEEQTERMYYVLEETHVLPSINYLAKIRNKDAAPKAENKSAHKEEAHHA